MDTRIYGKGYADTKTAATTQGKAKDRAEGQNAVGQEPVKPEEDDTAAILSLSKQQETEDTEKTDREKELERLQEMLERMKESAKAAQEKKKNSIKKRLNYNYRKVSGTVMRARSLSQASRAVVSAKTNLSTLQRKGVSGQYDSDEIDIAIAHAKRIINTAKKKLKHMKYETQINNQDSQIVHIKEEQTAKIVKEQLKEEAEKEIRELKKELKSLKKQRERADRNEENLELMDADMQYLRRKIELMKEGKGDLGIAMAAVSDTGDIASALAGVVEGEAAVEQRAAAAEAIVSGGAVSAGVDVLI